jgi:hypothetical protein
LKQFVLASSLKRFLSKADSKHGSRLTSPVSTLSTRKLNCGEPPFFPSEGGTASADGTNTRRRSAESARTRADRVPCRTLSRIKANRLNADLGTAREWSPACFPSQPFDGTSERAVGFLLLLRYHRVALNSQFSTI